MGPERILLVDDVPENLSVLTNALEPRGYEILAVSNAFDALKVAEKANPSLILLDVMMPGMDGLEACRHLKAMPAFAETPVIFITARAEMQAVVEGFGAGAVDYIVKPFQMDEVLSRVATHLRIGRLTKELRTRNRELSEEIDRRQRAEKDLREAGHKLEAFSDLEASRGNIGGLIGNSRTMRKTLEEIQRLNHFANTSVLILGESGTGKELIAGALHSLSRRAGGNYVRINCAAIPEMLLESELFGHEKGAFTGALRQKHGRVEEADNGTIFLDEIGDMSRPLQAKLLRFLEDGTFTRVGGNQELRVDVRLIAATNRDIIDAIRGNHFREDLFHRLNVVQFRPPGLRERGTDILLLAEHFLRSFSLSMNRPIKGMSKLAQQQLLAHHWPGNVRELRNVIERAVILETSEEIQAPSLPDFQLETRLRKGDTSPAAGGRSLDDLMSHYERELITSMLEQNHFSLTKTADQLKLSRHALRYRMQRLNITTGLEDDTSFLTKEGVR